MGKLFTVPDPVVEFLIEVRTGGSALYWSMYCVCIRTGLEGERGDLL
jgi:hypothetical protein